MGRGPIGDFVDGRNDWETQNAGRGYKTPDRIGHIIHGLDHLVSAGSGGPPGDVLRYPARGRLGNNSNRLRTAVRQFPEPRAARCRIEIREPGRRSPVIGPQSVRDQSVSGGGRAGAGSRAGEADGVAVRRSQDSLSQRRASSRGWPRRVSPTPTCARSMPDPPRLTAYTPVRARIGVAHNNLRRSSQKAD